MTENYNYKDDHDLVAKDMGLDEFNPMDQEIMKELKQRGTLLPE